MTRDQIVQRALRVVGDDTLTTQAYEWLDHVLLEIQSLYDWRFLHIMGVSQNTTIGIDTYTLPSNYNKRLVIMIQSPPEEGSTNLGLLQTIPFNEFLALRNPLVVGEDVPKFLSILGTSFVVYPRPDKIYTMNLHYYSKITLPTNGSDEIETVTGLPARWHQNLINGVIAEGLRYVDDVRQEAARLRFSSNILTMMREEEARMSPKRHRGFKSEGGLPRMP